MMTDDVNAAPGAETAHEDTAWQHRVCVMATEVGERGVGFKDLTDAVRLKPTM
jgi:hypothetical protein